MPKILLVDDDGMVRYALRELLEDAGFEVIEAPNGIHAVELIDDREVDLVITDIFMPDMDGLELIRHIRDVRPDLRVIAISGGGARQNPAYAVRLAKQMGADRIIQKPVHNTEFLAQISQLT